MELIINGQLQTFVPIQIFRNQWNLPADFGVAHFEPKDWRGLGTIDGAGPILADMKRTILGSVPHLAPSADIFETVKKVTNLFRTQLQMANVSIGLQTVEVDFAVAGFEDVMHSVAYRLLELKHTSPHNPIQIREQFDFQSIYRTWLTDTIRLSTRRHTYFHEDKQFEIRVVNHAYGRVGLEVRDGEVVYYVVDKELACPAESYMENLCREVANIIVETHLVIR